MNNMSSLEAAAEAAAKVNAMLIAKGKLKPPPSAINKCKGSNVKSAGDLFTSEVEINDAPLSARNLLTRGHTQDEINKHSGAAVSTRGRYMTFEEKAKNTGERPLYLYVQASEKHAVDLGVHRIQEIIQQHMQQQQNEQPQTQQHQPPQQTPQQQQTRRNSKFHKFVPRSANGVQQGNRPPPLMSIQTSMPSVDNLMHIPISEGPNYLNGLEKVFVGLDHAGPAFDLRNKVVGTGGTNLLYIRNETGAIVTLRGKGSGYVEPSTGTESPEPMYLCIEHPKFEGLQSAKQLAQNLVETLQQEFAQWQQQQQQQQQQMNTLAMQNSVLHPTQFQAMGVGMGQPGIVTVHQPLQQQELLQSGIPGMVTTSVALPVVSNMPTILAGQLQQAPQLANLQQHQQSVQHQVQQSQQHQHQMGLPPHIQTGHPPPPHAMMQTQQHHHQQQQSQAMGMPQQHHLQIHQQQQQQQGMGGGLAFPPQMHQAILSPLQTMSQPQQQTGQHMPSQHQGPPPPGVMTQHQMASITQMAQQTVQGTLLVSPGQMVFTQAPVSSPQHQSPQPQHPSQHHQSHQQAQQQQLPPQAQLHHQQPLAQTPPPPPLPPTNQQPPSTMQQQQHMPAFQQMYIPQQLQQQGAGAGGMGVPPMHAAMMHPPPMGLSPHPQPVPMPNMSNQPQQSPQMNNGMQHGFMGMPSNQQMQAAPNNSVHMGAYPYQQFSPAGNGPAGGMPGSGGAALPTVSYPIYRQEQRPPPPSGNISSDQQSNPGGQQQLMGGKTGAHKRRFTEDADHPDDGFQQGGMPVMNAMGQPPPPPPSHSPNHHQPPPRQGNGLQEMMVGSSGPSTLAPPSLQQQHGSSSSHQHQLQQHHPQHHHHQQQQDRDKQLMPPPPPPLPSGEKRPAGQSEPDVKRHKGALSSVSGYGSDEEDQNNGDESQQRQQRNQQQHGNGSSPSFSTSGGSSNFMPPKPTFTHYSSKPQMYGHHQGAPPPPLPSQTSAPSTQAQSPPNTSMPVTSTASSLTSTSPHNFQSLPCPPPQPPPPIQQHQMPAGGMYSSNPPPSQLAASQQQVPSQSLPPPSYANQGGQQHQQSVAFTGYQYNSSLPFWMVQQ